MKRLAWVVVAVLLCVAVRAETRTVNGSLELNISIDGNYSLTWPGGTDSGSVLPVTGWWLVTSEYEYPNFSSLAVEIAPGSQSNYSGCWDALNVSCASSANCSNSTVYVNQTCPAQNVTVQNVTVTGGFCNLSRSLDPGQKLNLESNGCHLNITATTNWLWGANDSYNVTRSVFIGKNGETFYISLGNFTTNISSGWQNASLEIPINFTCPITPAEQVTEADASQAFEVCKTYFPLVNSWLNVTLNRCFDNYDAYRDYVNTRDAVVAAQNQELSDCRAAAGQKDGELNVQRAQIMAQQEMIDGSQNTVTVFGIITGILFLALIISVGVIIVLVHRASMAG